MAEDRPVQREPGAFEQLVILTLRRTPGLTVKELGAVTGATKKTLQKVLSRLAEAGKAEHSGSGNVGDPFRWRPAQANGQSPATDFATSDEVEKSVAHRPQVPSPGRPSPSETTPIPALDGGGEVIDRVERVVSEATGPITFESLAARTGATREAVEEAVRQLAQRRRAA